MVAWKGANHLVWIRHEEVVEDVKTIGLAKAACGDARNLEWAIGRLAVDVGLDLHEQAGDEVDGTAHLGEFEQVQGHAAIILDAVQTNPGHGVLSADVVRIIGLMLVPEKRDGNFRRCHGTNLS